MKKLPFIFVIGATAFIFALLMGCASGEQNPSSYTPSSPQNEQSESTSPSLPQTTAEEESQSTGSSLDDIINQAVAIESVKFDMIVTSPEASMTTRIWLKGHNMRSETESEEQTVINIINHATNTMYIYIPEQNMAFKATYDPSQTSPLNDVQSINQYNPTVTGTETIDGKLCSIVEYSVSGMSVKMWLWQEKGFPLKVITNTNAGTTTVEYKNIEFIDIPDSQFEIPDGVQIMDMPSQ